MGLNIGSKDYLDYIDIVTKRIYDSKDYITELDSITGDGDHWVNINMGFQKIIEDRHQLEELKLGDLFKKIGMIIMSTVGGSSGALYGSAYIKSSKTIGDKETIDLNLLSDILEAQVTAIMERGKSNPGDKTMIDALYPAVKSIKNGLELNKEEKIILEELKQSAIDGMNSTKDMEAKKGRAYYQANKGLGHIDPGAVTMSYQIEELADYLFSKIY